MSLLRYTDEKKKSGLSARRPVRKPEIQEVMLLKIERINENQIRCILSTSDLHARHISLLELAYGNERARRLFREMIELADNEVGFHVDDIPLMIEAIPLSGDGIMLIITKVEDPDELDTRFAKFAPGMDEAEDVPGDAFSAFHGSAGDILETLNRLLESGDSEEKPEELGRIFSVFRFSGLDPLCRAAMVLSGLYRGENTLYRSESDHSYYLTVHKSGHTPEDFNKICNILTEYGERIRSTPSSEAYFQEHLTPMVAGDALQKLAVS